MIKDLASEPLRHLYPFFWKEKTLLNRNRTTATVTVFVLCVVALGFGIFYFSNQPKELDAGAKKLLSQIYSYTGQLTGEEDRELWQHIETLDREYRDQITESEWDRLRTHVQKVHGSSIHEHSDDASFAQRNADINQLITKVKGMDYPPERKAVILASLEEFRLFSNDQTLAQKDIALLRELRKTDPELYGLSREMGTGRVLKLYPNTVYLYKEREIDSNGTVREIVTGVDASVDEEIDIETYLEQLEIHQENPSVQDRPSPPPGVRFIDIYKDELPENPILKAISAGVDESSADIGRKNLHIGDGHEHQPSSSVPDATTSDAPKPSLDKKQAAKSNIVRDRLANQLTDDAELKRLLSMTDAELEAELERLLSPKLPTEERLKTVRREPSPTGKNLPRISPERMEKARAILNRYGREGGLRLLRASDQEVARQMEQMLQSGLPSNPQKEGKEDKPE